MNYKTFLSELDKKLELYFNEYKDFILCREGCSHCCEKGDYPISQLELEYLMQGFIELDDNIKQAIKTNITNMEKGGACPFLINNRCSVYSHRPIVCRVHGLAFLCKENLVKVPYCANEGKNFSTVYSSGQISINPIKENLDTPNLLKYFEFGEIRNLADWIDSTLTKS